MRKVFLTIICLIAFSCSKDKDNGTTSIKEYSFDESNSELMYKDSDDVSEITSSDLRYEIGKVIRVKPIDNFTIEVANFSPIDLEDVTILAQIDGMDQQLNFFKINKINAHATKQIRYSFLDEGTLFNSTTGKKIDLTEYKESGIGTENITFNFSGESEILIKLKSLNKLNWEIKWHDYNLYNDPNDKWKLDIAPKDARRLSGLMINLGYVLVSKEFEQEFLSEVIFDNEKDTLNQTEKELVFNKLLDLDYFQVGIPTTTSGRGGAPYVFGLAEHILNGYIASPGRPFTWIAVHEIGHMLGYYHDSNMTYPSPRRPTPEEEANGIYPQGISEVGTRIAELLQTRGDFIVTPNNYYKPEDFTDNSSRNKRHVHLLGACDID